MQQLDPRAQLLRSRQDIEDPFAAAQRRPQMEAFNLAHLNRRALRVEVTDDVVILHVRFQAIFLNRADRRRFAGLQQAVHGAAGRWAAGRDHVFHGRRFRLAPEVTLINSPSQRDRDRWLIEVRQADDAPVTHPGCHLDDPRPVVAAVTDSRCDGGVMNLPPSGVGNPDLIAHEMHHLFGLLDRLPDDDLARRFRASGRPGGPHARARQRAP